MPGRGRPLTSTLLAACILFAASAQAAAGTTPVFKQLKETQTKGTLTQTVTLDSDVTAGDLIYVAITYAPSSMNIVSTTDSAGSTYRSIMGPQKIFTGWGGGVGYAIAKSSGPLTITFGLTGNTEVDSHILVYSGVSLLRPFDRVLPASSTDSYAVDAGTLVAVSPGSLIVSFIPSLGNITASAANFNARSFFQGDLVEDVIALTAGPYTPTAVSDNLTWSATTALFLPFGVDTSADAGNSEDGGTGGHDAGITTHSDGGVSGTVAVLATPTLPSPTKAALTADLGCGVTPDAGLPGMGVVGLLMGMGVLGLRRRH